MGVLDELIWDTARDCGLQPGTSRVAVHEDPTGTLLESALSGTKTLSLSKDTRSGVARSNSFETNQEEFGTQWWFSSPSWSQTQRAKKFISTREESACIRGINTALELPKMFSDWEGGVVLTRLPASIEGLRYLAASLADSPGVAASNLVVGANNKYLTRNHAEVLSQYFPHIHATRGRGKFRCLIASGFPQGIGERLKTRPADFMKREEILSQKPRAEVEYQAKVTKSPYGVLTGIGSVFGGAKIDRGGELLARVMLERSVEMDSGLPLNARVLDLGCGNGLVSLMLSVSRPDLRIVATDLNADAVLSARATLGNRATVNWDDAGNSLPAASFQAVALNPPFHQDSGLDTSLASYLIAGAWRVLQPGGVLYLVFNSHLRYRRLLITQWADIQQLARNTKFTVLSARKI